MKLLFINLLLILCQQQPAFVKGNNYRGYIFDTNEEVQEPYRKLSQRYMPTKDDVNRCEKLLIEHLEGINDGVSYQKGDCPVIHKKLHKYMRQYVGFINDSGEKIIWINMVWNKSSFIEDAGKHIINVSDGCSYYWNIKVNLKTGELYELLINNYGG